MTEQERSIIRTTVLDGPEDTTVQLAWASESLTEHLRIEQRLMAKFKLADFLNDMPSMTDISKNIKDVRDAIGFLQAEVQRLEGPSPAK